jgi:dTDP-glucose pyrophosphorylase
MLNLEKYLVEQNQPITFALERLNELSGDDFMMLFVLNEDNQLKGVLTDGDIRRGFLKGLNLDDDLSNFMQKDFIYLKRNQYSVSDLDELRKRSVKLIPVLDDSFRILKITNFIQKKSILPLDALMMAGGRGERLKPLTDNIPKPMLKVGNKPIIEHNIDRFIDYGIEHIHISVRYMADQVIDFFKDGSDKNIRISYVTENEPLGTIGCLSLIEGFNHNAVLVMNSDLLTNIDLEEFYREFEMNDYDMSIATIPYTVSVPYAVFETESQKILGLKEKPNYTYYSNGGIYLIKKELINLIPKGEFYNATDLIELLLKMNKKVNSFPLLGYWLDIGKPEDFKKAQEDIKHIKL